MVQTTTAHEKFMQVEGDDDDGWDVSKKQEAPLLRVT